MEDKQQEQERMSHIAGKIEIARPISFFSIQQTILDKDKENTK